MLPRENIVTPRARTAWKYVPTDELAGDAVGLHLIDDRYLVAYVLDVSGHGVPAALLSVSAMHALEPIPAETSLLRDKSGNGGELGTVQRPSRVANELNRRFRAGENDGRYMTMVLAVLDTHKGRLHLAIAGHPTPFVLRGVASVPVPDVGGFPVAIVDGAEYEDGCIQLQPGDRVCLFSDGVSEQTDARGAEQFGTDRILQALVARAGRPAQQAVDEIVDELQTFAGSGNFIDDVSLVVLEWLG
jgi:sigma-B regulation protein RsbU (phosphoserine phosphatase)